MQPVAKTSEPRLSPLGKLNAILAPTGQALLDSLLVAEVTRLRADLAARDRGETGAEDAS